MRQKIIITVIINILLLAPLFSRGRSEEHRRDEERGNSEEHRRDEERGNSEEHRRDKERDNSEEHGRGQKERSEVHAHNVRLKTQSTFLSVARKQYKLGQSITVNYRSLRSGVRYRIDILRHGRGGTGKQSEYTRGRGSGSVSFKGINHNGYYEIKLYSGDKLKDTLLIQIGTVRRYEHVKLKSSSRYLRTPRARYKKGQTIVINYRSLRSGVRYRIDIMQKDYSRGEKQSEYTRGRGSGSVTFKGIHRDGYYEVKLYSGRELMDELLIQVGNPYPRYKLVLEHRYMKAVETSHSRNNPVRINYRNLERGKRYKLVMSPADRGRGREQVQYTRGRGSGMVTFPAVRSSGYYEIKLFDGKREIGKLMILVR